METNTPLQEEVILSDGSRQPKVLVTVLMLSLRGLYDKATSGTIEAMPYILALYDLTEICKGTDPEYTGECRGCFGKNRQVLLQAALVEGGERGPLTVRDEVRRVVNCALTFNLQAMSVRLQSPLRSEQG